MRQITIEDRQTLMDIAIQEYGAAAAFHTLCQDNNLDYDHELQPGEKLSIRDELPDTADANVVALFKARSIQVSTGEDVPAPEVLLQQNGDPITQNDGSLINI